MTFTAKPPYQFFTELDGTALEAGKIYIGTAGLDAESNPISVYWDEAGTVAAAQPIRTIAGVPDNAGAPSDFFVPSNYSISVKDKNDVLVYSKLNLDGNDLSGSVPHFDTIAEMASADFFSNGQAAVVLYGFNGELETFTYDASSALTADGSLVVDATGKGVGRLISTRTIYADFAEFIGNIRVLALGTIVTILGVDASYSVTGATGNLGQTDAAGNEFDVASLTNDATLFGELSQVSVERCLAAFGSVAINGVVTLSEIVLSSGNFVSIGPEADITYDPSANDKFLFSADGGDMIRVVGDVGGKITNLDSYQSGGVKVTAGFSGTGGVHFKNCTNCDAIGLDFVTGDHGVFLEDSTNCKIENCRASDQGSYSFINAGGYGNKIHSNYAQGSALDGFKMRGQGYGLTVSGNHAYDNFGDGFDLFDGFFESILSGNVAKGNASYGFECKGTPSTDYNFRDSVVSGNIASENLLFGFSITSVRGCAFSGNIAVENTQFGFGYDGVQNCTFTGDHAVKNGQHGFKIGNSSSCSRNAWTGCKSTDSGKTTANTYDGFWLSAVTDSNEFVGCTSGSGTGGDASTPRHGIYFETGAAGNKVLGGTFEPNGSASLGGDVASQKITMAGVTGGVTTQDLTVGTHAAIGAETVTGYIEVKDNSGTTRKVAIVS